MGCPIRTTTRSCVGKNSADGPPAPTIAYESSGPGQRFVRFNQSGCPLRRCQVVPWVAGQIRCAPDSRHADACARNRRKAKQSAEAHELLAPLPHNEQQRVAAHVFVLVAVERWLFSDDSRCPRPLTGSASRHRPRRSALAVRSAGRHSSGCFKYRVKHQASSSSTCRQFTCTPSHQTCATVRP